MLPGVLVGLGLSLAGSRGASSLLYGVSGTDPGMFAAMCAVVLVLSALVTYIPARRAAQLDPIVALRQE